jgi:hypothetical protein
MLARDDARVIGYIHKMTELCLQLKAASLRITRIYTINELSIAMEEAGVIISTANKMLDINNFGNFSQYCFLKIEKLDEEQDIIVHILEIMGFGMDDHEQDKLFNQICEEAGID